MVELKLQNETLITFDRANKPASLLFTSDAAVQDFIRGEYESLTDDKYGWYSDIAFEVFFALAGINAEAHNKVTIRLRELTRWYYLTKVHASIDHITVFPVAALPCWTEELASAIRFLLDPPSKESNWSLRHRAARPSSVLDNPEFKETAFKALLEADESAIAAVQGIVAITQIAMENNDD